MILYIRWMLIFEVVTQPVLLATFMIIALRIRRDQERMQRFLDIWAERLLATTKFGQ